MNALLLALRKARQQNKLSHRTVAYRIGTHPNSIAGWEGHRNTPRLDLFIAWAQTLGYNVTLTPLEAKDV